jgi:hypothetical protein
MNSLDRQTVSIELMFGQYVGNSYDCLPTEFCADLIYGLMGNELKYVVISRCSIEDFVHRLLIVKFAWIGWSRPMFFPPYVQKVFHVDHCVTCACAYVYIFRCIYAWLKLSSNFISHKPVGEIVCIISPSQQNGIGTEVQSVLKFITWFVLACMKYGCEYQKSDIIEWYTLSSFAE